MAGGIGGTNSASELFQCKKGGVFATTATEEGTMKERLTGFEIPLALLMMQ